MSKNALKKLAYFHQYIKISDPEYPDSEESKNNFLLRSFEIIYRSTSTRKREFIDINGVSLNKLAEAKHKFLQNLSKEIKTNSYIPSPLQAYFIKKDNKNYRIICEPSWKDKIVQKAVYLFLQNANLTLENNINYGFVKSNSDNTKKNVPAAIERALLLRNSYNYVYKTDIISFFDKIDRQILRDKIKKEIRLSSLYPLLFSIIDTEIHFKNDAERKRLERHGLKFGVGLRQGMPLSPYLSNLMLKEFDEFLEKNYFKAVRYADDLIFFSKTLEECNNYEEKIQASLKDLKLAIPYLRENSKSKIFEPKETADFLGLGLYYKSENNYGIKISDKAIEKMKDKINNYQNFHFCIKNNINFMDLGAKLHNIYRGYLYYYGSICDDAQINRIANTFEDSVRNIITNLFKNGLNENIDFSKLTKNQKVFWGLDFHWKS